MRSLSTKVVKPKDETAFFATLLGGLVFIGVPVSISLIKGTEKRVLWPPTAAVIESVEETEREQLVTYRYSLLGHDYIHTQRHYVPKWFPVDPKWESYEAGDKVYVHVHTRNHKLSILDPPIMARIWRDFSSPYPCLGKDVTQWD